MTDFMTVERCEQKHTETMSFLRDIKSDVQQVQTDQRELNNRLYKDNGRKSVQSMLNDHDRVLRVLIWIACTTGGILALKVIGDTWDVAKTIIRQL
ncbi:MAG: hypothetical protein WC551_12520 [Patescibacteria group bacterium]